MKSTLITSATKPSRLKSIDWLRGLVMVLMALDHMRVFLSSSASDPMADPNVSVLLYAARWITHLCAPTFVLLAGVSAGLMHKRLSSAQLSRLLLSRGIWLIFLDATVIAFAWKFNFSNSPALMFLTVLWAIGVSMMVLAILIYLPQLVILAIGLVIVAGSNLLDGILPPGGFGASSPLWLSVHRQILYQVGEVRVFVGYPVLAWTGLIVCGYSLAPIFSWNTETRRRLLFALGGGLLFLFFLLRFLNAYGDPNPWVPGETLGHTAMSFLNATKYPPSLHFISITIGLALLILALAEHGWLPLHDTFVTFGRVPLFYYIIHLFIIHLLAIVGGLIQGLPASAWLVDPFVNKPAGFGFSLVVIYLAWIGLVITLYPVCRWFAQFKAKRNDWWLSYL